MKTRISALVGNQPAPYRAEDSGAGLPVTGFIGTFHSLCVKILRAHASKIGYLPRFTIFDEDDSLSLIKEVMKELEINPKQFAPGAVLSFISKLKNELMSPGEYAAGSGRNLFPKTVSSIYAAYQKRLKDSNAMDFDDLIMNTCVLFENHPRVLESYEDQFRYINVDEWQDTSTSQYRLIAALAKKFRNIAVVGDDAQCLPPSTKILTPNGLKRIDTLKPNEEIIVAAGSGRTTKARISRVRKFFYSGSLMEIKTKLGANILITPNHILFGRLPLREDVHYVYLMYRRDRGFRIGTARGARHPRRGEVENGLRVRTSQEKADQMWILKVLSSHSEALYWEFFFSFYYGIPTVVFNTGGRGMKLRQKQINKLYTAIDTRKRAEKLMQDLQLSFEFPHWRPQGTVRGGVRRLRMRVAMFDNKYRSRLHPWCLSRVALNTRDKKLKSQIEALGYRTRKGKLGTWRTELTNLDYGYIAGLAEKFQKHVGTELEVVKTAGLVDGKRLYFQPASHIKKYIITAAYNNDGSVIEDEVQEVARVPYEGSVYDLDVDKVHNYIANGIVVHNSIYGWRNADYRNIFNFEKDFPEAKIIILDQNYRSTQIILDASNGVISKNRLQKKKRLWTQNKGGDPITVIAARDEREEARSVLNEMRVLLDNGYLLRDMAILYRTNAQSRAVEEALVENNLPYKIIGGTRFYQRKEIKDVLAYIRFVLNPADLVSLKRIINVPSRGIGKRALLAYLSGSGAAADKPHTGNFVTARSRSALRRFDDLIRDLGLEIKNRKAADFLKYLLKKIDYREYLDDASTNADERWENIKELLSLGARYDDLEPPRGLEKLLEDAALMSEADEIETPYQSKHGTGQEGQNVVNLMTLHAAKGLEFPIIFIMGLEEGILPHSRSLLNPNELEEERRLCYVGLTRAKEKIFLSFALQRTRFGSQETNPPSRFLSEIPERLLNLRMER